MQGTEVQFALSCDQHGTFVDEGSGGLIFYIVGGVSSLRENLPVGYIEATLVCFIDEDHLGKRSDHGLVEGALFGDGCDVSVVDESLDWEEQARLSTVGVAYQARYFVLVSLLPVV